MVSEHGIELVVPKRGSVRKMMAFLAGQRAWVEAQWVKRQQQVSECPRLRDGEVWPILGADKIIYIQYDAVRSARILLSEELRIIVPEQWSEEDREWRIRSAFARWLRREFQSCISEQIESLRPLLPKLPGPVSCRWMRSRWGSCSADGAIRLNLALAFVPTEVRRYVVAHELAHLIHRHHQPSFWAEVDRLDPGYKLARLWLKRHGDQVLHLAKIFTD